VHKRGVYSSTNLELISFDEIKAHRRNTKLYVYPVIEREPPRINTVSGWCSGRKPNRKPTIVGMTTAFRISSDRDFAEFHARRQTGVRTVYELLMWNSWSYIADQD
jgi:hypothetical protein